MTTDTTTTEQPAETTDTNTSSPNREAANYRTKLRAAEADLEAKGAELAAANERTDAVLKDALGVLLSREKVNADTLWRLGVTPDVFLKDGGINAAELPDIARSIAAEHGLTATIAPNPAQSGTPFAPSEDPDQAWAGLLSTRASA